MGRLPLEVADLIRTAGATFIERNRKWLSLLVDYRAGISVLLSNGRNTLKHVPARWGRVLVRRRTRLPSLSMNTCETQRPSPVPLLVLVVKKGSNNLRRCSGWIPGPLSPMTTRIPSRSGLLQSRELKACTTTLPPIGTASRALITRFVNTCRISPAEASTGLTDEYRRQTWIRLNLIL